MSSRTFPAEPDGASRARHFLRAELAKRRVDGEIAETAELLLSELASNVVRHAGTAFVVDVSWPAGRLRVSVEDGLAVDITAVDLLSDAESGRGLRIVDTLADRWGVDRKPAGKAVWFELSLGQH